MTEEITEDNIKALIKMMPESTTPLERLVLANFGTVQTLLSVLFKTPIKVEVISQIEKDEYIVRWSKLVAEYSDEVKFTVCLAESIINKDTVYHGFITGIKERTMGIGQLIDSLGIRTERKLLGFHTDNTSFSRTYSIESTDQENLGKKQLCVIITELFSKEVFVKLYDF